MFAKFQVNKNDSILLLVGEGPLRGDLERMVTEYKLEDKVVFTGFQVIPLAFQAQMDICAFTSENEAFGLVILEMLSLGKPVIVFKDAGGAAEIISDYESADVVKDIDEYVERLNFYYQRREVSSNSEKQRRIQYANKFSVEKMGLAFKEVYKNIT